MTKIACIGEAMIELSLKGSAAQVGVAGDTLNTAIYLKRAAPSVTVDYVTKLGDDPFSTQIREFIAGHDIGTDRVAHVAGGSPGLYAITTSETGERTFTYWRSASAARALFGDLDFEALNQYDALYLSGITLAILPHPVRMALIDWLNKSKVTVIFDSNFRPRLWEGVQAAREVILALYARADIALPSVDDEMLLFDQTEDDVLARIRTWRSRGALKRGARGPLSIGTTVEQHYPPVGKVVDTTAAGDSFNGAYIAAVLTGHSQAEALMAGHDCASRVVQHRGAIIPA
jgi:2-dehydro-3-deoxygluconokinase